MVIALLFIGGVLGALVIDDDGDGDGAAVGPATTVPGGTTTAPTGPTTTGPATTDGAGAGQTTTTGPGGEAPRTGGSGLDSSGTGQVASGQAPTPETGMPEWLLAAGIVTLALAGAFRRLSRASS